MPSILPKLVSSTGASDPAHDPLAALTAPPRDESDEQRAARQQQEEDAKKVSDEIDKFLKRDAESVAKRSQHVRLLLLGQSESGKSSALKSE
ncbi:hypothetical protein PIIN_04069 [Serendipita indica DSM 11827]|uniref:Uncharacterized protein n=1 Tax=Serendipita indica (strain DSM 11827) TaxID=1109443 RepID=G4TFN7_SERID|nr:hypothetical protein PIIN_04069 [Serendipita indica DSM 11827]